jgi:catechol 2,3-dioxygenase-like lactoylglutathione lyase family enzyme
MPIVDRLVRFHMAVNDLDAVREFYTGRLGFSVVQERSQDGDSWLFLTLPGDEVSLLLTTERQYMKPGTMKLYFSASDVEKAHAELAETGMALGDVRHDPWATWFDLHDPDGNQVIVTG